MRFPGHGKRTAGTLRALFDRLRDRDHRGAIIGAGDRGPIRFRSLVRHPDRFIPFLSLGFVDGGEGEDGTYRIRRLSSALNRWNADCAEVTVFGSTEFLYLDIAFIA